MTKLPIKWFGKSGTQHKIEISFADWVLFCIYNWIKISHHGILFEKASCNLHMTHVSWLMSHKTWVIKHESPLNKLFTSWSLIVSTDPWCRTRIVKCRTRKCVYLGNKFVMRLGLGLCKTFCLISVRMRIYSIFILTNKLQVLL